MREYSASVSVRGCSPNREGAGHHKARARVLQAQCPRQPMGWMGHAWHPPAEPRRGAQRGFAGQRHLNDRRSPLGGTLQRADHVHWRVSSKKNRTEGEWSRWWASHSANAWACPWRGLHWDSLHAAGAQPDWSGQGAAQGGDAGSTRRTWCGKGLLHWLFPWNDCGWIHEINHC